MSLIHKKIKIGKSYIEAISINLSAKKLVLLKGKKGFVMCGYLNLKVAEKFKDAAIKIAGVSSIDDALQTTVHSCTSSAGKLGIHQGQSIKEILPLIA